MSEIDILADLFGDSVSAGQNAAPEPVSKRPAVATPKRQGRVPMGQKRTLPKSVHESELAEVLGLTRQRIGELVRNGVIYRVGVATFDLRDSIQKYTDDLKRKNSIKSKTAEDEELKAAKLKLTQSQARRAAIIADKDAGKLLDAIAVEKEWTGVLRDVRATLLAVPSRIGATLPHLTPHDVEALSTEIHAALESLANGDSNGH